LSESKNNAEALAQQVAELQAQLAKRAGTGEVRLEKPRLTLEITNRSQSRGSIRLQPR
jgi:hypothetical protein